MAYGQGYLFEVYEKAMKDGAKAKDLGNLPLAKSKFKEALAALEGLAKNSVGDAQKKQLDRIEKLRAIISSIPDEIQKKEMPKQNATPRANVSSYQEEDVVEGLDDVSEYVTIFENDKLKFGFEGVAGLADAKDAITEYVINPIKYKDAYNYSFMDNRAILLYGPPGTGKTTFAKAVAKETGLPFFLVSMSSLVNCYIGETAKTIDKVFSFLRRYSDTKETEIIVFFDEFDEIAKKRNSDDKVSEAAVPALLRNLDGLQTNKGMTILANTNYRENLDDAVRSRFRRQILIPLPDFDARKYMYQRNLMDVEESFLSQLNLDELAMKSDGLSGRDIAFICDDFKRLLAKSKAGLANYENIQLEFLRVIQDKKGIAL